MANAKANNTNWFAIWTSAGVVAAIAVIVVIVAVMNNAATTPQAVPEGSGINQETGAIAVGEGEDTLDTYIDFMCPVCGNFEATYGEEIVDMVNAGDITLNIHPISILDRTSLGTEYSTRAANAMYCVAEASPDAALPFMQAMFANQPSEGTEGMTDDQMLSIAADAGATGIDTCVTEREYGDFVQLRTQDTPIQPGSQGIATPTLEINGEVISNSTIPAAGSFATLFG